MHHLDSGSVDMVLCDLPYGVTNEKNPRAGWDRTIDLERFWFEIRRIAKDRAAIVHFGSGMFTADLMKSAPDLWRYNLIWEKDRPTGFLNANRAPLKCHEEILVFCEKGTPYHPIMTKGKATHPRGERNHHATSNYGKYDPQYSSDHDPEMKYPRDVIRTSEFQNRIHPTQKPVEVCEYMVRTYTDEGMTVLDSCMGSGTTGVACVRTNRSFVGIEKDPTYYAQAVERIASSQPAAKPRTTLDDYHSESCTEAER